MCLIYTTDKVRFSLRFRDYVVLPKVFLINQKGQLCGANRQNYRFKMQYSESHHWLWVPPAKTTQDVIYYLPTKQLSNDCETMLTYGIPSLIPLKRKKRLGYHTYLIGDPCLLSDLQHYRTNHQHEEFVVFPVLSTHREVIMLDNESVVVSSFRIPDPEHYENLYTMFFREFNLDAIDIADLTVKCREKFQAIRNSKKKSKKSL